MQNWYDGHCAHEVKATRCTLEACSDVIHVLQGGKDFFPFLLAVLYRADVKLAHSYRLWCILLNLQSQSTIRRAAFQFSVFSESSHASKFVIIVVLVHQENTLAKASSSSSETFDFTNTLISMSKSCSPEIEFSSIEPN